MKRSGKKKTINKDSWMNTYSDMVTLLLCFFVLLFASSSLDSSKWQVLVEELNPKVKTMAESASVKTAGKEDIHITTSGSGLVAEITDFSGLYENVETYAEENNLTDLVKVIKGDGYVFIVFRNSVFFDGDKHDLRPQGKQVLDFLCSGLTKVSPDIQEIQIHGHTNQADPSHPNPSRGDWMLSADRAAEVTAYMQSKNFIDPKRFVPMGHGQYYPTAPFVGEENRSQNRRVEILIQEKGSVGKTLDQIYAEMDQGGKAGNVVEGDAPLKTNQIPIKKNGQKQ